MLFCEIVLYDWQILFCETVLYVWQEHSGGTSSVASIRGTDNQLPNMFYRFVHL